MSARTAFESRILLSVAQRSVESVAVGGNGQKLFVGTSDGNLQVYDIDGSGADTRPSPQSPGRVSKEKKPVQSLQAVAPWRALLGIVDSFLVAYHIQTHKPLGQVADSKGCSLFAVHAPTYQLCVAVKRRVLILSWNGTFQQPRREVTLAESPRAMLCTATSCCIALRKEYACMALSPSSTGAGAMPTKSYEMDKEHKNAMLVEIPALPTHANSRVLVSNGDKGALMEVEEARVTLVPESRVAWSAPPRQAAVVLPFLVSLLVSEKVEVHDISSFAPLQLIDLAPAPIHICSSKMGVGRPDSAYVAGAGTVQYLAMVPLEVQVEQLVGAGQYEEAIAICSMFQDDAITVTPGDDYTALLANIDLRRIHELYADMLFSKNSYDDAVDHYIKAETPVGVVCAHFNMLPDELPRPRLVDGMISRATQPFNKAGAGLAGPQLNRACHALLVFLQHHRQAVKEAADRAELQRSAGRGGGREEEDIDEIVATAVMVDTMLVASAVRCRPPRRDEPVHLLSGPNRCHVDSCYPLLAAEGPQFIEALLWLYRSKGEHRRALGLLSEDKCVSRERGKGWSLPEFHRWWSDYLRFLWLSKDLALPPLVLANLRQLLDANPRLGLRVLVGPEDDEYTPQQQQQQQQAAGPRDESIESVVGGRGTQAVDVLNLLKGASPRVSEQEWKGPGGLKRASRSLFYRCPGSSVPLPLVSGTTLAVAYLDWLVAVGAAPPNLHDEFFLLLLTGLLSEEKDAAQQGRGPSDDGRSPTELGRVFQEKLREFLRTSTSYHPERLLPALEGLPAHFLQEKALLLSKLGRHEEVLQIYVSQLKSYELAESYCDDIWRQSTPSHTHAPVTHAAAGAAGEQNARGRGGKRPAASHPLNARPSKEDSEVYLALFKVYLKEHQDEQKAKASQQAGGAAAGAAESKGDTEASASPRWLSFLERNYARIDAVQVLQMLPDRTTPLKAVNSYLCKILRHCATERRYKEVVHQLLRVEELKIQQELIQEQSRMATVTESTVCRVCKRSIGSTAILCYPNGIVVHFACGRGDYQTCPVTGQHFGTPASTSEPGRK